MARRGTMAWVGAIALVAWVVAAGCGEGGASEEGTDTSEEWSSGADASYECEPVAIPCCNEAGAYVTRASCTESGLTCPEGTHTDEACQIGGLDTGTEPSDGGDTDGSGPVCDGAAKPCCDDETQEFVGAAECTDDGLTCPEGSHSDAECTFSQGDTGVDGGDADGGELDGGELDGGDTTVPPDTNDGGYDCDAVAIPCCDESGAYVTNAECTASGLQCPSGTHQDGQCMLPGPDAGT